MAMMNVIGLTNKIIERHHYEHIVKKKREKIPWLDFAEIVLETEQDCLFPYGVRPYRAKFHEEENKTETYIELRATLQLYCYSEDYNRDSCRGPIEMYKYYEGKSTRTIRFKKTRRPKNEKDEMTKEARKAALMKCFEDRFGFTDFSDILVDEFHRPVTD